jgi:hypothetical protein
VGPSPNERRGSTLFSCSGAACSLLLVLLLVVLLLVVLLLVVLLLDLARKRVGRCLVERV